MTLLAYPPIGLWPIAWFSLLPMLWATRGLRGGEAFRRGWWAGLIFNAGLLYWVALNSGAEGIIAPLSFLGMLLVFPLYWAIFAALWAYLHRRWGDLAALCLPALWVALEVIKNAPEIGFPWQELGLTQIGFGPAAQMAELGGIRLVSAWVVGANTAGLLLLSQKKKTGIALALILLICPVWGAWRLSHLPQANQELSVLLVQGNIDPALKWQESADSSFAIYESLSREAGAQQRLDLILWPETAIPSYLGYQYADQQRLRRLAKELGSPILTGAPHYQLRPQGGYDRFNSAFFFPADGSAPQRYDKMRLVPFGERVPFQALFPRLGELNFGQAEFTAGKSLSIFKLTNGVQIAPQICFESVFGDLNRQFVAAGAQMLCNLTNDGWYGNSSGPYQHAALVRFRSIESRCPLARAANTGISMAVDRAGRVTATIPYGKRGAEVVRVMVGSGQETFYVKHGEMIPHILAIMAAASLLGAGFARRRSVSRDRL